MAYLHPLTLLLLFLFVQIFSSTISHASVPASHTFKYVNDGDFGYETVEYDARYRVIAGVSNSPFQLCLYSTTANAFTLALLMGTSAPAYAPMRWVWEANRGKPVRENATLTFGVDGNIVLADSDGRVAWQTGTANKGVVGLKLLPNGNMVLHDSKGKFIWQSFDYPTDTLLVGQSLKAGSAPKLVSRTSEEDNSNGPYSLVMEAKSLAMYYKSNKSPNPLLYFIIDWFLADESNLVNVKFIYGDETADYLALGFDKTNSSSGLTIIIWSHYNSTMSFLRLGLDGNIRFYTFNDKVERDPWVVAFTLFSRGSFASECQLPDRCGKFGLCEDSQCVACPKPNGLMGWSKDCEVPKIMWGE